MSTSSRVVLKDLIVIGGGSGGLAVAKEASKLGASVTLFDYVRPSPHGTRWGLGGTCVNVGCVPKKLMHHSGLLGHSLKQECQQYGWNVQRPPTVDWDRLRSTVQEYIKRLNFGYKSGLRSARVEYINSTASFGPNGPSERSVEFILKGEKKTMEAKHIAIAVGGRPYIPPMLPGADLCITSDDIFSLRTPPGRTLVVGGSYVALETAGFLNDLGVGRQTLLSISHLPSQYPVALCIRSLPLRGFDRQCSEMVLDSLVAAGVRVVKAEPNEVTRGSNGRLRVHLSNGEDVKDLDSVVMCIGRRPELSSLSAGSLKINARRPELSSLSAGSLKINAKGFLDVDEKEQTNLEGVYGIGDVTGRVELTPVAIRAGELLARRLFSGSDQLMNYNNIPTTIFTPTEYGCVGLSQEKAEEIHGNENIEVFLQEFDPLEISPIEKSETCEGIAEPTRLTCLAKLVCLKKEGALSILGIHFVGPNAGEVIQGLSLAVTLGVDKKDLDNLIGIHPTMAEVFTNMETTLRSGSSYKAGGGCGGGKCG